MVFSTGTGTAGDIFSSLNSTLYAQALTGAVIGVIIPPGYRSGGIGYVRSKGGQVCVILYYIVGLLIAGLYVALYLADKGYVALLGRVIGITGREHIRWASSSGVRITG